MNRALKATLILLAIMAATAALVFGLLFGVGHRNDKSTDAPLPSDQAARAYVTSHSLLQTITTVKNVKLGGPQFKLVQGTDSQGNEKVLWLTGTDNAIVQHGSVLLKDGVTKESILPKAAEKGIPQDQIEDMFVAPYDYTSGKIVWFVRDKDVKHHMLWYNFKTGDLFYEAYEDPTAWNLPGMGK